MAICINPAGFNPHHRGYEGGKEKRIELSIGRHLTLWLGKDANHRVTKMRWQGCNSQHRRHCFDFSPVMPLDWFELLKISKFLAKFPIKIIARLTGSRYV
jgi:hypothetical protein